MGALGRIKGSRGFSLIEMMVAVAIVGILCATAIPGFIRYIRRAKSAEPREHLRRLYDSARHYFVEPDYAGVTQIQPKPPQFPVTASNGNFVASPNCCAMGGTMERCQPEQALWEETSWIVLHFNVPEPHYFAYSYVSRQGPAGATDGSHSFTARARGNLDCDETYSEFAMFGTVNSQYADGPSGTGLLKRINELE